MQPSAAVGVCGEHYTFLSGGRHDDQRLILASACFHEQRESWVRGVLFAITAVGCVFGFPEGYGQLSPTWAAVRCVAHVGVGELAAYLLQRMWDSQARTFFVQSRSGSAMTAS